MTVLDPSGVMGGPTAARVASVLDWNFVRASLPRGERDKWIDILDFGASSKVGEGSVFTSVGQLERTASADRRKAIWLAAFSASLTANRENGVDI